MSMEWLTCCRILHSAVAVLALLAIHFALAANLQPLLTDTSASPPATTAAAAGGAGVLPVRCGLVTHSEMCPAWTSAGDDTSPSNMLRGQSFVVSSRGINSLAKSPDSAIFVTDETNSTTTVFDSIVQDHLFIKMRHVVELQRIFQCAVDSDSLQPKSSQSLAQSTARLMEQWMYRLRYARSMACADVIFASQNVGDCDSFLRYRIRTNQQQQQPENTFQVFDMNMLTSAAAFSTANRGDRLRQGGSMDLALLDDLDESFITKSTTSASSSSSSSSSSSTESQSPNSKSSSDAPADPRMSGFLIKRGHHLHHRQLPSQLPVLTWPDAPLTSDLQRALLPLCRTTCITHARDVAALVNNSTTCPFPSPSSVSASSRSTPDDREIQMITEYRHRKLQEFFSNCDRHPFNGSNNIDSANGNSRTSSSSCIDGDWNEPRSCGYLNQEAQCQMCSSSECFIQRMHRAVTSASQLAPLVPDDFSHDTAATASGGSGVRAGQRVVADSVLTPIAVLAEEGSHPNNNNNNNNNSSNNSSSHHGTGGNVGGSNGMSSQSHGVWATLAPIGPAIPQPTPTFTTRSSIPLPSAMPSATNPIEGDSTKSTASSPTNSYNNNSNMIVVGIASAFGALLAFLLVLLIAMRCGWVSDRLFRGNSDGKRTLLTKESRSDTATASATVSASRNRSTKSSWIKWMKTHLSKVDYTAVFTRLRQLWNARKASTATAASATATTATTATAAAQRNSSAHKQATSSTDQPDAPSSPASKKSTRSSISYASGSYNVFYTNQNGTSKRTYQRYPQQFLDRLASPTSATSTAPRQVLQTYFPRRPDEILLTINDIVDVKSTFADGWAVGFNRTTSSEGAFPVVCILTTEELAELEEMMLEERRKALRQQQQQQQSNGKHGVSAATVTTMATGDDVDDGRLEMTSFMVKPLPTETDYESLQLYSVESASDTEATAITTTTTTTATTATASPLATRERGEIGNVSTQQGILTSIFSAVKNTFASLALHSHSNNSAHSQNLDIGRIIQPRTDSLEKQSDQPSSSPVIISPSSSRTSASSPPLQPPPPVVPRPRPLSSIFRPTQQFQSHHSNEPNIVHAFEHTRLSPRLPPPRLPSSPLRLPQIPGMPKPHPADVIDPIPSQQQSQQPKPSLLSTLHKPWNYQYLLESRDRINTPESLRQRLEALSVIKNQQQQTSQPQSQSQLQLQTQIQPQHNLYPDYI